VARPVKPLEQETNGVIMTPKRKFKKIAQQWGRTALIAIVAIFIAGAVNAQGKMKIAVMELKAGTSVNQSDVEGLSGMLTTALDNTGNFTLIERYQIDKAIREQGFQKSSMSNSQVAKVGSVLGVAKVLVGDVTQVFGEYNVDIRIIDVSTGVISAPVGKTLKGQEYRTYIQQLANELSQKLIASGDVVKKAELSYSTKEDLLSGATWLMRNFPNLSKYEYYSYFTEAKRVVEIVNKNLPEEDKITPQAMDEYIETDFEQLQYYKTNGLPKGLTWKNVSLGNILYTYDIPENSPIKRYRYVISNSNATVDIIYAYYQGKYYLMRIYKAFQL